jgi:hypothetical protein
VGRLPFGSTQSGLLHARGVMDLLLELNVRVDFVRYGNGSVKGSQSALASQGLTSLRYYLVINFDGPHGHIRCFKRNLRRGNDCAGSTVRRGSYLVAMLIHKKPAGLVPV